MSISFLAAAIHPAKSALRNYPIVTSAEMRFKIRDEYIGTNLVALDFNYVCVT